MTIQAPGPVPLRLVSITATRYSRYNTAAVNNRLPGLGPPVHLQAQTLARRLGSLHSVTVMTHDLTTPAPRSAMSKPTPTPSLRSVHSSVMNVSFVVSEPVLS